MEGEDRECFQGGEEELSRTITMATSSRSKSGQVSMTDNFLLIFVAWIAFSIFLLLSINNRRETLQQLIEKVKDKIKSGDFKKLNEIR